jgi:hypothetical protein
MLSYMQALAIAREFIDRLAVAEEAIDTERGNILFADVLGRHGIINAGEAKRILALAGAEMVDRHEKQLLTKLEGTNAK